MRWHAQTMQRTLESKQFTAIGVAGFTKTIEEEASKNNQAIENSLEWSSGRK